MAFGDRFGSKEIASCAHGIARMFRERRSAAAPRGASMPLSVPTPTRLRRPKCSADQGPIGRCSWRRPARHKWVSGIKPLPDQLGCAKDAHKPAKTQVSVSRPCRGAGNAKGLAKSLGPLHSGAGTALTSRVPAAARYEPGRHTGSRISLPWKVQVFDLFAAHWQLHLLSDGQVDPKSLPL